jgi:DNA-directed RNA polymerase specialized sigma24 family protein
VKAYFSIKNFDGRGSLYTWIYRMAVNEAYAFLRNERPDAVLDRAGRHPELGTIRLQRDSVNKSLDLIPEEDRCLLFLRDFEGHSIAYLTETKG